MDLKLKKSETICIAWCLLALISLYPVTQLLDGAFPIFTIIWLLVPLLVVLVSKDAQQVGFHNIPWGEFWWVTAINLAGLLVITLLIEPWSQTYRMLLEAALENQPPDTTFAWLLRFDKGPALCAMLVYSGFVTMFGEELFFRGWLLQQLKKRWRAHWAIVLQATLFVVPNLLATLVLPPLQSFLYVIYSWLAVGIVGGWAASKTNSIWPSLFSVTVANLLFVAWIL